MVKLYAIVLARWPLDAGLHPIVVASAMDLNSFSFFQRNSVKEWCIFFSKTLVENTKPGVRQSVQNDNYVCHVHVNPSGLSGVVVADTEYPQRAAFKLLAKIMDEFTANFSAMWNEFAAMSFPQLERYLETYQDPLEADKIAKVMKEVEETKIIMHETIDAVLQRGASLDQLVQRSDDLSKQSKKFYKTAKKMNRCCIMQ